MRALPLVVFLAFSAFTAVAWFSERWTCGLLQMSAQEEDRTAYLEMLIRQRQEFLPYFNARMEDVVQDRLSLAQASALVMSYAEQNYPWFLEKVQECQPGPTLHYKFAHNMVLAFSLGPVEGWSCWNDPSFRKRITNELAALATPR